MAEIAIGTSAAQPGRRLSTFAWCAGAAALTLATLLASYQGMQATDDFEYASFAQSILAVGPRLTDKTHRAGRLGAYLPLAVVFRLLGVSSASLSLLPVLATALTAPVLFLLAERFFSRSVGIVAAGLFAFSPYVLQTGAWYVPEPLIGLEISTAALLYFGATESAPRPGIRKALAGILIGIAWLTSEPSALMLPILLAIRYFQRELRRSDWILAASFVSVFLLESAFWWSVYGHPFYRFASLGKGYHLDTMVQSANAHLIRRLFKSYPQVFLLLNSDLGWYGLLFIAGGLYGLLRLRTALPFVVWSAVFLIFFNFGSCRLTHYVALPAATRLIYPACLPLHILAAALAVDAWNRIAFRPALVRCAVRLVIVLAGVVVVASSIFASYLEFNAGHAAVVARNAEAVAREFSSEPRACFVSDWRTCRAIAFYRAFRAQDRYQEVDGVIDLDESFPSNGIPCFVVINGTVFGTQEGSRRRPTTSEDDYRHLIRACDRAREAGRERFASSYRRPPPFERVIATRLARYTCGEGRHSGAMKRLVGPDAKGWVRVFDCTGP